MTESDLRRLLNNLEACRASLHGWLHFWTFLVVVGVALEVISLIWEYLKELKNECKFEEFKYNLLHDKLLRLHQNDKLDIEESRHIC